MSEGRAGDVRLADIFGWGRVEGKETEDVQEEMERRAVFKGRGEATL